MPNKGGINQAKNLEENVVKVNFANHTGNSVLHTVGDFTLNVNELLTLQNDKTKYRFTIEQNGYEKQVDISLSLVQVEGSDESLEEIAKAAYIKENPWFNVTQSSIFKKIGTYKDKGEIIFDS